MIFNSILFYLLIININENVGLLQLRSKVRNECSLRLDTKEGVQTCLNLQCSEYKDPRKIILSHNQDQPCYFHYLKLTFTSYDQFLLFVEAQTAINKSLGEFFDERDTELCMLEIIIDTIYPFNEKYFLSESTLNKLGGNKRNIEIFLIEIKRWYMSARTIVQIIENDLVHNQPFEQITILFKCHINRTIEELVLAKYNQYQERSTCPTQIFISTASNISKSEQFHRRSFLNQFHLNNSSINQSNLIYNEKENIVQWDLIWKILIIIILILFIIGCIISGLIYLYFQSDNE